MLLTVPLSVNFRGARWPRSRQGNSTLYSSVLTSHDILLHGAPLVYRAELLDQEWKPTVTVDEGQCIMKTMMCGVFSSHLQSLLFTLSALKAEPKFFYPGRWGSCSWIFISADSWCVVHSLFLSSQRCLEPLTVNQRATWNCRCVHCERRVLSEAQTLT